MNAPGKAKAPAVRQGANEEAVLPTKGHPFPVNTITNSPPGGKPADSAAQYKAVGSLPEVPKRRVSLYQNAKDNSGLVRTVTALVRDIHTSLKRKVQTERIRRIYAETLQKTGTQEAAKDAVAELKKALPGVTWSGEFTQRRKKNCKQHTGLLCADLDAIHDPARLAEVRGGIRQSPHLVLDFVSPTGHGLKAVFAVPANIELHEASWRAVRQHVLDLCGVEIDAACKDVNRLCFLAFDPECAFVPDATELDASAFVEEPKKRPNANQGTPPPPPANSSGRRGIAEGLLGEIRWETDNLGFCECPGVHKHTQGNGARDCRVTLDGAPTIHCLHNSCRNQVDAMNRELRSRIGKDESADQADSEPGRANTNGSPANRKNEPWKEMLTLPKELPPIPDFPIAALPEPFRDWTADCAERMQCPPDYLGVSGLFAAGVVLGNRIGIAPKEFDDWIDIPTFWGVLVGRPGMLKTPALSAALSPLRVIEDEYHEAFQREMETFEAAKFVAETKKKKAHSSISKLKADESGEAMRIARDAVIGAGEPPKCRRLICNDSTTAKVCELAFDNPQGIGIVRDELMGLISTMESEGHDGDRELYLEGWNGTNGFTVDRIVRGTHRIPKLCLSIIGGIQPGPLMSLVRSVSRGGRGADGFLQRFGLIAWPDITEWEFVDRPPHQGAMDAYHQAFRYLNSLGPGEIGARPVANNKPFALRFSPEAQDAFSRWFANHERRIRRADEHPAFEGYLAKVKRLVISLALLHHLTERKFGPVALRSLEAALCLQTYFEAAARRVFSSLSQGPVVSAIQLARRLQGHELPDGFTARQVERKGWSGLDSKESATDACEILCELNWLREEQRIGIGRSSLRYRIHPDLNPMVPGANSPANSTEEQGEM
jgi:hypothetical protein